MLSVKDNRIVVIYDMHSKNEEIFNDLEGTKWFLGAYKGWGKWKYCADFQIKCILEV